MRKFNLGISGVNTAGVAHRPIAFHHFNLMSEMIDVWEKYSNPINMRGRFI